jgi:hypothetical protein
VAISQASLPRFRFIGVVVFASSGNQLLFIRLDSLQNRPDPSGVRTLGFSRLAKVSHQLGAIGVTGSFAACLVLALKNSEPSLLVYAAGALRSSCSPGGS